MRTRIIELSANDRKEVIQLPINPAEITFMDPQNNQQVTLLDVGTVNLLGERGLISVTFESFFPSEISPLYSRGNATRTPKEYKALIKKWKDNKSVVRMIITDLDFNLAMSVDSFEYRQREGDNDIYYSITLTEYKTLNVPSVKVSTKVKSSIKTRPKPAAKSTGSSGGGGGNSYTVKSNDTLWAIATRFYGNGTQYMKIYNANSSVIESTAKAHGFSSSQQGHWIWAGTQLTIPK